MTRVFIGSAAVAAGRVTKYDLRARYQRVLPDVYAPREPPLNLADRTSAAWLWSGGEAVITGLAATALHGAKWLGDDTAIELNWPDHKSRPGVITRDETLHDDEIQSLRGMRVTTAERTAFDIARRGRDVDTIQRLDALAAAAHFKLDDVQALVTRHPRLAGVRQVAPVLARVDAGAQSPKETWLRLVLIEAGFPPPVTQIPVLGTDGFPRYYLDMGWPELMVAVEYDGEQHRLDRAIYRDDLIRSEYIAAQGWSRIRVIAGDRRPDIVRRVRAVCP